MSYIERMWFSENGVLVFRYPINSFEETMLYKRLLETKYHRLTERPDRRWLPFQKKRVWVIVRLRLGILPISYSHSVVDDIVDSVIYGDSRGN